MQSLIHEFNAFFEGSANIEVSEGLIRITIGNETLVVSLPEVVGGESRSTD